MSDFARNARLHADRLRATRLSEVVIHHGAAEFVVHTDLLDTLELATLAALNDFAAEIDRGERSSAEEAEARLRKKLNIRQPAR